VFQKDLLKGKRILVTGGGTGLGREHGGPVKCHIVDIRDAAAVDAMVQAIWDDGGPLTGLVNNAAGNFISRTEDLSPRGFDAIANIVFHGTFYVTHAIGKRWIAGGHKGSVISIVVTWVWTGSPFVVPSAMSKAGVHVMTQSLAVEWGRYGIRLNAIAPGIFPTEGAGKRLAPGRDSGRDAAAVNPMGRAGKMQELQNLAAFLMADGAEFLTGQTIAVDGGACLVNGGSFNELFKWTDADWENAREAIKAQNEKDKAQRST